METTTRCTCKYCQDYDCGNCNYRDVFTNYSFVVRVWDELMAAACSIESFAADEETRKYYEALFADFYDVYSRVVVALAEIMEEEQTRHGFIL